MTIKQTAFVETAKFALGTVALGAAAAYLFTQWPQEFGTLMALAIFGYMIYFYWQLTVYKLERERDKIVESLKREE